MLTLSLWLTLAFISWEKLPSWIPLCHILNWRLLFMPLFHHVQVVQIAAVRLLDKVSSPLPLESTLRFWLLEFCMDKRQCGSEKFFIHTSPASPWGHVIRACWMCSTTDREAKETELLQQTSLALSMTSVDLFLGNFFLPKDYKTTVAVNCCKTTATNTEATPILHLNYKKLN